MSATIYGLYDTADGSLRYVGSTLYPLQRRMAKHRWEADAGKLEWQVYDWIRAVGHDRVEIRALVVVEDFDRFRTETAAIKSYKKAGVDLLNVLGCTPPSEETRRKISEAQTGKPKLNGPAVSAAKLGVKLSEEHKQNMSRARTGLPNPKVGDALRGRKRPPEVGRKVSASKMGHEVSEETRRKIGDKNRGKAVWADKPDYRCDECGLVGKLNIVSSHQSRKGHRRDVTQL